MDVPVKFSFLKLFNSIKGIGKTTTECDPDWLQKRANKQTQERYKKLFAWLKKEGVTHPKVKYPVMFGKGDAQYPGMQAVEAIGPNETLIQVPSRLILSTKKAFDCAELRHVWFDNPEVFGKHVHQGDDNLLIAYILFQLNLGDKSVHFEMMNCWPTSAEADILMNWDDDTLEWLQDEGLLEDATKGYEEMSE